MALTSSKFANKCWMRQIEIRLRSKIYKNAPEIVLGGSSHNQLSIEVQGEKYLSSLKDSGTVSISNLTYAELSRIVLGKFFEIEIWAGYKSTGMMRWFKGEIAYISNKIQSRRDNTCYMIFASELVASYSQQRINLQLNSGINLYAAFKYICMTSGISSNMLSDSLKNVFLNEITSSTGTPASLIDQLSSLTNDYSTSADSSLDGSIVDCSSLSDKRRIRISSDTINLSKGNPTISSDGLSISLLPTFQFKPGDIILIDNSLIDASDSNLNSAQTNFKTNYMDSNGAYMIIEMRYEMSNRGNQFGIDVKARSIDIIKNVIGAS